MGLDDEYGSPAGPHDTDPAHIRALAVRMATFDQRLEQFVAHLTTLTEDIKLARQEGRGRDEKISHIEEVIDKFVKRLTEEDLATMRMIIKSHDRHAWLWKKIVQNAGYIGGTATAVWLLREPIQAILQWLGKASH